MAKRKLFVPNYKNRDSYRASQNKNIYKKTTTKRKFAAGSMPSTGKQLQNSAMAAQKNALRKHPDPSFNNVSKMITVANQRRDFRVKTSVGVNFSVGKISPPAGLDQEDGEKNIKITHDVKVKSIVLGSDPVNVYNRKIETGISTSKNLLEVMKENGSTTQVLFDTKSSIIGDSEFYNRKQLTFGTGFDQKGLTVFGDNAYASYHDIRNLCMGDTALESMPPNTLQRITAGISSTRTEIALRNQSAFMRCYVKIHLVKHKSGISAGFSPIDDLATSVFSSDLSSTSSTTARSKVPVAYQYSPVVVESNGGSAESDGPNQMLHVDYAPDKNVLNYSPYFKEHFEIVESAGQMLGPGDFLNFSHIHHYGKGFDITRIFGASPNAFSLDALRGKPTSYFYMIEYRGYPCEVTHNRDGNYEAHLGTSPVILSSEIRKKITFANKARTTDDLNPVGVANAKPHMLFEEDKDYKIDISRRKFNLPLSSWTNAGSPVADKFVITLATDRTVRADIHVGGNTGATDVIP